MTMNANHIFSSFRAQGMQPSSKRQMTTIVSGRPDRFISVEHGGVSPQEFLLSRLKSQGTRVKIVSYKLVENFFFDPTPEEIESYQLDILTAVRNRDMVALRSFHGQGRPLKCSNRYGESILHLACRKGFLDVVKFLVEEADVPFRVRDDFGRTPLHDAMWTAEPNLELVDYIITHCPDLLYIRDRRDTTPFAFVRKPNWEVWVNFIKNMPIEKFTPKILAISKQ